jgi:hypothetical protein
MGYAHGLRSECSSVDEIYLCHNYNFSASVHLYFPRPDDNVFLELGSGDIFLHKQMLMAGFLFPSQPIIQELLSYLQLSPFQVLPNGWRLFTGSYMIWPMFNDKAIHALCQALSPSEFTRILNCEVAKDAWQILETTYECTKLVKSAKLQMLISKFEEIKMLEEETFGEFYT